MYHQLQQADFLQEDKLVLPRDNDEPRHAQLNACPRRVDYPQVVHRFRIAAFLRRIQDAGVRVGGRPIAQTKT